MSGFCFARDVSVRLRVSRTSNEAHRRFILLRGKSLILGKSLNSIDKDEVATVEDDRDDRPFFDSEWQSARPLEEV